MSNLQTANEMSNQPNTWIKPYSNVLKVGVAALGVVLSSNQMPAIVPNITTDSTSVITSIDGILSTKGVYSNVRYSYAERYRQIAKSAWFKDAYQDKSLGEIKGIEA